MRKNVRILALTLVFAMMCIAGRPLNAAASSANLDLRNYQFAVTDLRSGASHTFNGADGKAAIILFGGVGSCGKTVRALRAISQLYDMEDMSDINVYVFDIKNNTNSYIINALISNDLSDKMVVNSITNSNASKQLYRTCYFSLVGGSFTMPLILYKGTDGVVRQFSTDDTTYNAIAAMLFPNKKEELPDGVTLYLNDGKWKYIENQIWIKDKYGFVNYDGGKFLVANGIVATQINGLAQDPAYTDIWYFLSNGQAQTQYRGLALYDGAWFYISNGILNTNISGYVPYDGGLFYVGAGRIMTEVNGLAEDPDMPGVWYYLANGQAQTQYTGLAFYDGEWFYVVNGRLASAYTGRVAYDGQYFNVVNGMVQ